MQKFAVLTLSLYCVACPAAGQSKLVPPVNKEPLPALSAQVQAVPIEPDRLPQCEAKANALSLTGESRSKFIYQCKSNKSRVKKTSE